MAERIASPPTPAPAPIPALAPVESPPPDVLESSRGTSPVGSESPPVVDGTEVEETVDDDGKDEVVVVASEMEKKPDDC